MDNGKSPHILSTSSTILGICIVVITGIKVSNHQASIVLNATTITSAFFMYISSVLSYLSIRSKKREEQLETWADNIFLIGLFLLLISVSLMSINLL